LIRRALSAEDEPALLASLHADSLALGVAVERPWRRQLLEDPRELGAHLERDEDAPDWLLVRRQPVWLEGADAVFGEVIRVGTELGGDPMASCPLAPNAVDWAMTSAAPWERLVFGPFGFDLVRTQLALVAPFEDVRSGPAPGVQMAEVQEFPEAIEGLARLIAGEAGAMAARDKALLDWRFTKRAGCEYRIALASRAGELVGCTVLRRAMFDGRPDQGVVCEWLVPGGDAAVGNALRSYLVERARVDGAARLVALLPDWHPSWLEFQSVGFRVERTRALVCARSRSRRHEATWLAKRWYTTLFDGSLA
jgi:hypothetical protein